MLRAIVTFLVGAGVMMGAFVTGVAQRVPSFLSRFEDETALEQPQNDTVVVPPQRDTVVVPRQRDTVVVPTDRETNDEDARAPVDFHGDYARHGDYTDETERTAMALQIEAPRTGGCVNTYRFINDTNVPITFLSDTGRIEVPPGASSSPDSGVAPDQACGPAVRIHAEQ